MTNQIILKTFFLFFCFSFSIAPHAQENNRPVKEIKVPAAKPYKVLTNGSQITFQSKMIIQSMLVWTASGHRILEEKNINEKSYTFKVSVKEKIFFVMLEFADGKRFTEKIGVK
jgi:cytochrome bd-type quinol oxidase subunit 1